MSLRRLPDAAFRFIRAIPLLQKPRVRFAYPGYFDAVIHAHRLPRRRICGMLTLPQDEAQPMRVLFTAPPVKLLVQCTRLKPPANAC